jgi:tryptophanyl-tRNA synthetase
MSTTTTSIFSFDHGQKKMSKAIGVTEEFLGDLEEQVRDVIKDTLFDEDRNIKEDISPSMLVEAALHNFSYSQLVMMSSFFLQDKLDGFTEMMEKKLKGVVKKIAIDSDNIPDHIKEMLINMAREGKSGGLIDGNDLPQELKDFLDGIASKQDGDGDDD